MPRLVHLTDKSSILVLTTFLLMSMVKEIPMTNWSIDVLVNVSNLLLRRLTLDGNGVPLDYQTNSPI